MAKTKQTQPRWWSMRPAQNLKPATYRCPFCGGHLPALSEHVLIAPEDDRSRRRHAHTECVMKARRDGRLPTREEWRAAERTSFPSVSGGKNDRAGRGDRASAWGRLRQRLRGG